ncbi:MAG TPA: hypothetical protein DEF51_23370, partial [Myxococcales bacterium]|nr:hypothetical protein [Myxococcales bacterium]
QMAREAGQREKAEKSYRALLLVVRRQDPGAPDVQVGASEVLYELSLLAHDNEDEAQAKELLETALSTAAQHDAEAERLKKDLVARGEVELALTTIEKRLEAVDAPESEARMLSHKAQILAEHQDRKDEALAAILQAVELAPETPQLHRRARDLAHGMGQVSRYAELLENLANGARRKKDSPFAASVLLRLGRVTEEDLGDLDAASELYQRVEKLGERVVEAWQSL